VLNFERRAVKKVLAPSLLLAVAVLLAAGCGGGSSSGSSAYPKTKADYAKALNDICGPATSKIKGLGKINSISSLTTAGPKISEITRKEYDDIAKIQPPAEIKNTADDYVSILKSANDKLTQAIDAAKAGDSAKAASLAGEITSLGGRANADIKALGADACGNG
jgi:hypothetical protein